MTKSRVGEILIPVIVRYIPDWFPGAGFKKVAREYSQNVRKMLDLPFAFTKFQMANKAHSTSMASTLIEQGEDEDVIKWSAVSLYAAGFDTVCKVVQVSGF
jgi:hypothetical protein